MLRNNETTDVKLKCITCGTLCEENEYDGHVKNCPQKSKLNVQNLDELSTFQYEDSDNHKQIVNFLSHFVPKEENQDKVESGDQDDIISKLIASIVEKFKKYCTETKAYATTNAVYKDYEDIISDSVDDLGYITTLGECICSVYENCAKVLKHEAKLARAARLEKIRRDRKILARKNLALLKECEDNVGLKKSDSLIHTKISKDRSKMSLQKLHYSFESLNGSTKSSKSKGKMQMAYQKRCQYCHVKYPHTIFRFHETNCHANHVKS